MTEQPRNAEPANVPAVPPGPPAPHADLPEIRLEASRLSKVMQAAGLLVIVGVVLTIFAGFVLGVPIPGFHHSTEEKKKEPPPALGVRLVRWFKLTDDSATAMRAALRKAKEPDAVVAKLDSVLTKLNDLKGRTFKRKEFDAEIAKRLDEKEREQFRDLLLKNTTTLSHTLAVPVDVRMTLGIRKGGKDESYPVQPPKTTRPLVMYGSTALDPSRLMRIRARFAPAEVVSIGKINLPSSEGTITRELSPGDRVKKGDVLGIFFSVDVAARKNDLLDALVQLLTDQEILDRYEKSRGSIPDIYLLQQERAVQGDRNAVHRALQNLKLWNIPQDEIDAIHVEAKKLSADKKAWFKTPEGQWVMGKKQAKPGRVDPDKENENPWGRVTLRAPFDGVIVERNIVPHEMVVDNTVNLFQIAQLHRLLVVANAPEDELTNLIALAPTQRRWTVKTVGPQAAADLTGPIDEIGRLIDPNQHTAVIKGYIENPHEQIRAGQFVSTTVQIPPPPGVVEIPLDSVVEDGQSCVVFVQTDPNRDHYTMRRVQLKHRFDQVAFVRSTPFSQLEKSRPEEKDLDLLPLEPLLPGEHILKTGVGELKAALLDLESRPKTDE